MRKLGKTVGKRRQDKKKSRRYPLGGLLYAKALTFQKDVVLSGRSKLVTTYE